MKNLICERCFEEYDEGEIGQSKYFDAILCTPCEEEYKRELVEFRICFMNRDMRDMF
jgi:hypothetical protein